MTPHKAKGCPSEALLTCCAAEAMTLHCVALAQTAGKPHAQAQDSCQSRPEQDAA